MSARLTFVLHSTNWRSHPLLLVRHMAGILTTLHSVLAPALSAEAAAAAAAKKVTCPPRELPYVIRKSDTCSWLVLAFHVPLREVCPLGVRTVGKTLCMPASAPYFQNVPLSPQPVPPPAKSPPPQKQPPPAKSPPRAPPQPKPPPKRSPPRKPPAPPGFSCEGPIYITKPGDTCESLQLLFPNVITFLILNPNLSCADLKPGTFICLPGCKQLPLTPCWPPPNQEERP